jgi:hypothetical protein
MNSPKIFCIGFHKTGTSSMAAALRMLGYSVTGPNGQHDPDIENNVYIMAEKLTEKYDAFQDNPWPIIYRWCHQQFPDAKFIFTVRDPEKWYRSQGNFGERETPMRRWIYGKDAGSPIGNKACYIARYNAHNAEVREYFKNNPNFVEVDITAGDGWEGICGLLGRPIPVEPFPHANPTRERLPKKVFFLKRWKRALMRHFSP